MLFSWPSLNPGHIGVIGISKWRLFVVEPKTPLSSFYFDRDIWPWMLILTMFLKSILNCFWFGIKNSMFGPTNANMRGLWATQRGVYYNLWLWYHNWNVIHLLLINDIIVLLDLCCLKTWGVWISGMKFICMYVWNVITDDVVIDENNLYETMLVFMIILIWDDVVIVDNVIGMRWCWCWCW